MCGRASGAVSHRPACNAAMSRMKRNAAQKRSCTTLLLDELAECLPDLVCERAAQGRVLQEILNRFVYSLEEAQRYIFLRRYWYGATVEELSPVLGCSESRVTGILFRYPGQHPVVIQGRSQRSLNRRTSIIRACWMDGSFTMSGGRPLKEWNAHGTGTI